MAEPSRLSTAANRPTLLAAIGAQLRAGGGCVLPTETTYLLVTADLGSAAARAATRLFVDTAAVRAAGYRLPPRLARLAARYWPGPLTLTLDHPEHGTSAVRVPGHELLRAVLAAHGGPLGGRELRTADGRAATTADAATSTLGAPLPLVVDGGRTALGDAGTHVRADGARLVVDGDGILSAHEVLETAARQVLFVCTGNTCRSPLAEVLARHAVAEHVAVPDADVLAHGLSFASAGTSTCDGMPASENSVVAAAELGLDLTAHASRELTQAQVGRADLVYALAASHRRALLAAAPQAAAKVQLLRSDGRDIADPYGEGLEVYRRARQQIAAAIEQRLPEWLAAIDGT